MSNRRTQRVNGSKLTAHSSLLISDASLLTALNPPGRSLGPVAHGFDGPCCGFLLVARCAGIRDCIFVRHRRRNEAEGVGTHVDTGYGCFNLRHVTGDALASGTAGFVMGVFFQCRRTRSVERQGTVTIEADLIRGLA